MVAPSVITSSTITIRSEDSGALPTKSRTQEHNIEFYHLPRNQKGKAPYDKLSFIVNAPYLMTKNTDHHRNGEIVYFESYEDFIRNEIIIYERVRSPKKEKIYMNGRYWDDHETVNGEPLYTFVPVLPLAYLPARRTQGMTLPSGSLDGRFFSQKNSLLNASPEGYLRVLYVALTRFESLENINVRFERPRY